VTLWQKNLYTLKNLDLKKFYQAYMGQTQLFQVASNYGEYFIPWLNQGFKVQI